MRKTIMMLIGAATLAGAFGAQTTTASAIGLETVLGAAQGAYDAHRYARSRRDYGYDDSDYGYGVRGRGYGRGYYDDRW